MLIAFTFIVKNNFMTSFEPTHFRHQFPLLGYFVKKQKDKQKNIYFDNAATTQKPQCVIDVQQEFYQQYNANVHRASHALSAQATQAFEQARETLKQFINARVNKEIIWTKGTTESINLVAQSLARNVLKPKDEIVLSVSEHHANIVPWQLVAEQTGAVIKILPLTEQGIIDLTKVDAIINDKTKLVACAHISNVLGRINPIKEIITKAKAVGAYTLIDGAQAVAHLKIDVQALGCDFYVFSAHKMYGPTGIGVLYGQEDILDSMCPYQGGGEMIKQVSFITPTSFNELPFKFEAGTPNIAGVIAFAQAVHFLQDYLSDRQNSGKSNEKENYKSYQRYEKSLSDYCYQALRDMNEVNFIAQGAPDIGVIAFTLSGHHNHDIATALDSFGIAIRSGHHCAMPLMESMKINGCLRISLAAYNTFSEVDYFITCLRNIIVDQASFGSDAHSDSASKMEKKNRAKADNAVWQIKEKFALAKSWDSRHREIMLLGKQLNRLDKQLRNEQSLISGCESQAWLIGKKNAQGLFTFSADSDAKIIRGLLVIVLAAFNDKNSKQISEFTIEEYFAELGLMQHLSPSRGNGLLAIVDKIKQLSVEPL
jgi:cysteine desulfurase/selenocysteine lyase